MSFPDARDPMPLPGAELVLPEGPHGEPLAGDADGGAEPTALEERFRNLVAEWKAARGYEASINKWARLPAYREIIALGKEVIPLLLRELEHTPDHWFWALKELTGANPVTPESRGDVMEMARCWVRWGKEQGYRL